MQLDTLLEKAKIKGYNFKKGSKESSIQTKIGDVDIVLNEGRGQAHCYIGKYQIQLFQDNENLVDELIHERDHFQIFPYGLISTGIIIAGTLAFSASKLYQTFDWKRATVLLAMETITLGTFTVLGGLNLVQDSIIYVRDKYGLNRN